MATYQVTIQMSPQTLQALLENGYYLYALHAVRGASGGQPLAWVETRSYAMTTVIEWTDGYQAYVSTSQQTVVITSAVDVALGQTVYVPSGTVKNEGVAGAIGVVNQGTQPFTSGIALKQGAAAAALCAFQLFPGNLVLVSPVQQVFLMFSTVGGQSAVVQSLGPGVLVDMTGDGERQLTFDIDQGWSWGSFSWARAYPPLTDLAAVLIQPFQQLAPSAGTAGEADAGALAEPAGEVEGAVPAPAGNGTAAAAEAEPA